MSKSIGEIVSGSSETSAASTAPVEASTSESAPESAPEQSSTTEQPGETLAATQPAEAHDDDNAEDNDPHPVPRKALIAERKKRQEESKKREEIERKFAELTGRMQATESFYQRQATPEAAPKVDPDTDFYGNPVGFVDQRLSQARQQMSSQFIAMSEAMVKAQFPDAEEKIKGFHEAVKSAPHLVEQMRNNPMPALFAYEVGKDFLLATKYGGNVDEMIKSAKAEAKAEALAEFKKQSALSSADSANKSIASARGTGAATSGHYDGPKALADIVRMKAQ